VDSNGIITTVAGTGAYGYSGDGGLATQARLNTPFGVAVGSDGVLYIGDRNNHRIRRVEPRIVEADIPTGAGGSIHIETGSITDADTVSRIEANGGGAWDQARLYTGAGGRVFIGHGPGSDFDQVRISAYGGASSETEAQLGAAGTIYLRSADGPGVLKVSNLDSANGQTIPSDQPTPVEVVGKHRITTVTNLGDNRWSLVIDGTLAAHRNYAGYYIDPDVSDLTGPYYEIVDTQGENGLIVFAMDDLSGMATKDLAGVHKITRLQLAGGATVDFGSDRIMLTGEDGLNIASDSTLQTAGIVGLDAFPTVDFNLSVNGDLAVKDLVVSDANLTVKGLLDVTDNLSASSVDKTVVVRADAIDVGADAHFDGVTVVSPSVAVYGDLTLINGTTMTVPEADESTYYTLDIWVDQTLKIYGAAVDVSGKGYPQGRTFGNLAYAINGATAGSHASPGGHESAESLDAYGDYLQAEYPGSGGRYGAAYGAPGGGVVRIQAQALDLDQGAILANGGMGASVNDPTGAGGSIYIEVSQSIQDTGMLSLIGANGGGAWDQPRDYTGSGGRVVLRYAADLGFNEDLVIAHGGPSSATGAKLGGAGTVYIQQVGEPGDLKISNADPVNGQTISSAQTTPIEVLGKRYIESVTDLGDNNWLIQVAGSFEPHRNYAGYLIDPDASDVDGPYYEILGIQNENGLLVYSANDLSFFDDGDLVGVHEFGKLQLEGGAAVDFGWDRPLVPSADAFVITADIAELQAGSFSGWENVDWPPGFNLTLNGNSAVYEWRLSNMNWDLTLNGDLEVAQVMAIRSVDREVFIEAQAIKVGGDATFSGVAPNGYVTVITPLLDVEGVLFFDEGSEWIDPDDQS
jgi:hypothetical protein